MPEHLAGADNVLWMGVVFHYEDTNGSAGLNIGLSSGGSVIDRGRQLNTAGMDFIGVTNWNQASGTWNNRINATIVDDHIVAPGYTGPHAQTVGTQALSTTEDLLVVMKFTFGASDRVEAAFFKESDSLSEAAFYSNPSYVSATYLAGIDESALNTISYTQQRGFNALDEIRLGSTFANTFGGGAAVPDFDTWAGNYPGLGAAGDDDDGDGLTNDYEHIFGLNPQNGASANPYAVPFNPATGGFSYTRRTQSLTGLTYKVWYSTDLDAMVRGHRSDRFPSARHTAMTSRSLVSHRSGAAHPTQAVHAGQRGRPRSAPSATSGSRTEQPVGQRHHHHADFQRGHERILRHRPGQLHRGAGWRGRDHGDRRVAQRGRQDRHPDPRLGARHRHRIQGDHEQPDQQHRPVARQQWNRPVPDLGQRPERHQGLHPRRPVQHGRLRQVWRIREPTKAGKEIPGGHRQPALPGGERRIVSRIQLCLAADQSRQPGTARSEDPRRRQSLVAESGSSGNLGGPIRKGDLGPPYQGEQPTWFGPEFAFGQILGDFYTGAERRRPDHQVRLGRSGTWRKISVRRAPWPSAAASSVPSTTRSSNNVREVLNNLGTQFPDMVRRGYEIVGFAWHQGYNDRLSTALPNEYKYNLPDLISDVRTVFNKPNMPFVIGSTGMATGVRNQAAASLPYPKLHRRREGPALGGRRHPTRANVLSMDTRPFWRDAAVSPQHQGHHWN